MREVQIKDRSLQYIFQEHVRVVSVTGLFLPSGLPYKIAGTRNLKLIN